MRTVKIVRDNLFFLCIILAMAEQVIPRVRSVVCNFCGDTTTGNDFTFYETTGDGEDLYICPECDDDPDLEEGEDD